jgi:hypothetical protein
VRVLSVRRERKKWLAHTQTKVHNVKTHARTQHPLPRTSSNAYINSSPAKLLQPAGTTRTHPPSPCLRGHALLQAQGTGTVLTELPRRRRRCECAAIAAALALAVAAAAVIAGGVAGLVGVGVAVERVAERAVEPLTTPRGERERRRGSRGGSGPETAVRVAAAVEAGA